MMGGKAVRRGTMGRLLAIFLWGGRGYHCAVFRPGGVMSLRTIAFIAVLVLSWPARAQSRSAVAGTWAITFTLEEGTQCTGRMHLSGVDTALTGAVTCNTPPPVPPGTLYTAVVSGEFDGSVLHLNLLGGAVTSSLASSSLI